MPPKIRLAVIGTGWWATDYHIPGILEHPDAELVAICDPHAGRLAEAAQVFHVQKTYPDHQAMLQAEALDGAIVVTPHATHYAIARDCLDRGLHVLVEKPMTLAAREARHLLDLAGQKKRHIMIGYTYHHYNQTQRARQAILSGELGEIQYLNSSFSSNVINFLSGKVSRENSPVRYAVHGPSEQYNQPQLLGGGQGHLQLTHSIGLMLYITGLRALRVQAMMSNHGLAVDLVDAFSVEFEGGALGLVGGTGNAGAAHRMALAVYCSQGCYVADTLARFSAIYTKTGEQEKLDWEQHASSRYAVTHNFVDVIKEQAVNYAPGEVGWRTVELLDAAYRSAQNNGQAVTIEELYV